MATGQLIATRQAYGEALVELAEDFPNLVVLDADLSGSTGTGKFAKVYPSRFFNVGIAEQNMISIAAGLAACGKTPFASSFAMFATGRAWEQVRNSVAHNNFNVKIAASHAGITLGQDGASHQIIEDVALMSVIPGMIVLLPADATETKAMVRALLEYEGPAYIRLGRSPLPVIFEPEKFTFTIGRSQVLRQGRDVTLIAAGVMVEQAIRAADMLLQLGIDAEVINCSSVKPLDERTILNSAEKTKAVVVAEEHNRICGINQMISGLILAKLNRFVPMEVVAIEDRFGQSGEPTELLASYGLTAQDICSKAKSAIARKF